MALTLGEKVQRIREKMGWSRKELADRAGLHPSHIGLIERGGRTEVRPDTLAKLAAAFEVPLMYFVTDSPVEYAKYCFANLQTDPTFQGIHISFTGRPFELRKQYIVDEIREMWGEEAARAVEQSPEIDRLVDPFEQVNNDCEMTQAFALKVAEAETRYNNRYWEAVQLALEHDIPAEDMLAAVQFMIQVKGIKKPATSV